MDKEKKFVITINRELGSGGRTVGRKLAEKLGVPYYDKLLIQSLQEKYNLTVDEIEKEKGNKHPWLTYLKNAFVSINQNKDELWYYRLCIYQSEQRRTLVLSDGKRRAGRHGYK